MRVACDLDLNIEHRNKKVTLVTRAASFNHAHTRTVVCVSTHVTFILELRARVSRNFVFVVPL